MKTLPLLFALFFAMPSAPLQSPVAPQKNRLGKDYAVFFYVTDFKPGWESLPETKTEALVLKAELETNFGFQCEAVANPSKAQILAKLKSYNDRISSDDQLLLFFSMHGHYDASAERGYLIPAVGTSVDEYGSSWLSYDDLGTYLARCQAKHLLLALDACHSGSFGIRNKARPEAPTYAQTDDCAQRLAKMLEYKARQYCTSGNKEAKTPAKSRFADKFLEALRKGGEEGLVRFDDLEYSLGKIEHPQPESGTFRGHEAGGDFVFVRQGGCVTAPPKPALVEDNAAEERVWKIAQKRNDIQMYLDEFPNGKYKEEAERRKKAENTDSKSLKCRELIICETSFEDSVMIPASQVLIKGNYRPDNYYVVEVDRTTPLGNGPWKPATIGIQDTGKTFQFRITDSKTGNKCWGNVKIVAGLSIESDMVFVKGGSYDKVTINDFYINKYEITQAQWKKVMGKNPSKFAGCDNCPVENINQDDVDSFILKLALRTGVEYRLPTGFEWKFAYSGGTKSKYFQYAGSNIIDEVAWWNGNSKAKTHPVGLKTPNELGLFDMNGNVEEMTLDHITGKSQTYRGGSWKDDDKVRNYSIAGNGQFYRAHTLGFRLARSK